MTMDINDESLSAYIDGELPPAEAKALEAALQADPGARLRLARLREADARMRAALPLAGDAAVRPGDSLAQYILGRSGRPENIPLRPSARAARLRTLGFALAAGTAGLVVGSLMKYPLDAGSGDRLISAALAQVLDQQPSGLRAGADLGAARVTLSFQAGNGQYCRVFARDQGGRAEEGVACRERDGWQLIALDRSHTATGKGGFQPAGASPVVDAVMDRLGGGAALAPAEEQQKIQQRWQSAAP